MVSGCEEAKKLKIASEFQAGIKSLDKLTQTYKELKDFVSLDGNFFHGHTLMNDNLWDKNTRGVRENLAKS